MGLKIVVLVEISPIFLTSPSSPYSLANWPEGIAVDPAGNVYVVDTGGHRIMIWGSATTTTLSGSIDTAIQGTATVTSNTTITISNTTNINGTLIVEGILNLEHGGVTCNDATLTGTIAASGGSIITVTGTLVTNPTLSLSLKDGASIGANVVILGGSAVNISSTSALTAIGAVKSFIQLLAISGGLHHIRKWRRCIFEAQWGDCPIFVKHVHGSEWIFAHCTT
jgi:hypothetical protein